MLICKKGHKITEPSAQIPTFLTVKELDLFLQMKLSHKITEPSAQIPTEKGIRIITLAIKSQNNRAFRSNPNF